MLSLSSTCEGMPLDLPSTCGWEPATVCTQAFVTAGDVMVVMTTAFCTKFNTDYTVPVLILKDPLYQFPLPQDSQAVPGNLASLQKCQLPRASCLDAGRPSVWYLKDLPAGKEVSGISKFLLLPATEQI